MQSSDLTMTATANANSRPEEEIQLGLLDTFLGFYLRLANDRVYGDFVAHLGADIVPPGHFTILTLIANNPGINQVAISRASGRDKSSVTKILRAMEDSGLITRERIDDDRRSYASRVTEAGAALAARLAKHAEAQNARLAALLSPPEREQMLASLQLIISKLG